MPAQWMQAAIESGSYWANRENGIHATVRVIDSQVVMDVNNALFKILSTSRADTLGT